jgi:NAD(P)-dependent dehydrogenase (short-subunit alcohol dehydrogenase family)
VAVVWVSGASSGLGLYTAKALQAAGWQVVGGARSFSVVEAPGLLQLTLDVDRDDSVEAFCQTALDRFGAPDALVNCAGIVTAGACEDYSMQELKRVMDVNFYGMVRMIQQVLPLMRARGEGRIVNFSSINGLLATPFQGAYTASKHAVEGFSEALRMELAPQHIQVMLVEPGDHRGGQDKYRTQTKQITSSYRNALARTRAVIAKDEANGLDPARLGRKVARAMAKKRLPLRLRVAGLGQHAGVWLHDLLPGRLFTRLLSIYYHIPGRQGASAPSDVPSKEDTSL